MVQGNGEFGIGLNQAILGALDTLNATMRELINKMEQQPGYATDFGERRVDLTSANTDLEITVPRPCSYIEAWSDGILDGISIKIGDMGRTPLYFNRFNIIPVANPERIWLTNDVRAGRSELILAFSRGAPLNPLLGGAGITQSELAARLGSVVSYDRRGEVIFIDDFENGLVGWETDTSGAGAAVTASIAHASFGLTSAKLVAGSDASKYAEISRYISPPVLLSPFGGEMRGSLDSNVDKFEMTVTWETGAGLCCYWGLKYDHTNSLVAILTAASTWTTVRSSTVLNADLDAFVPSKLVVNPDLTSLAYERFTVGYVEVTCKPYTGYYTVSLNPASVKCAGRLYSAGATNAVCHIDSFIATQNEPI